VSDAPKHRESLPLLAPHRPADDVPKGPRSISDTLAGQVLHNAASIAAHENRITALERSMPRRGIERLLLSGILASLLGVMGVLGWLVSVVKLLAAK
jgi:hypothetical protein